MVLVGREPLRAGSRPAVFSVRVRFWRGAALLTEQEVARNWRSLFSKKEIEEETFARAEALLEELRPESPLRHRLGGELDELRQLKLQRSGSR